MHTILQPGVWRLYRCQCAMLQPDCSILAREVRSFGFGEADAGLRPATNDSLATRNTVRDKAFGKGGKRGGMPGATVYILPRESRLRFNKRNCGAKPRRRLGLRAGGTGRACPARTKASRPMGQVGQGVCE